MALFRAHGDRIYLSYALGGLGVLAFEEENYVEARGMFEEALSLERELGDPAGASATVNGLGTVLLAQGDYRGARALFEESKALCVQLGNRFGEAQAVGNLGTLAREEGDLRVLGPCTAKAWPGGGPSATTNSCLPVSVHWQSTKFGRGA